jgi:hypothetical protein
MLGFETIGNATLVCFDDRPLLVTDPWINDAAYFGSWGLSHEIPPEQMEHILACEYVWFSHGHPDHLNGDSLPRFSGKKILLADFVGGRIKADLSGQGFDVTVLADRTWVRLSKNVEVMCISDYYQDSILLIRIGDRLVINLNDACDHGWGLSVRAIARQSREVYLLRLAGYGDADMINLWDESGRFIEPWAAQRLPVGPRLAQSATLFGANHVIPFSAFHCYRRADSVWAERYTTPVEAHAEGFTAPGAEVLPAFVRVDAVNGEVRPLSPRVSDRTPRDPKKLGDDWGEELGVEDRWKLSAYFLEKEVLRDDLGFVTLRVGGKDFTVDLNRRKKHLGITFEAPRGSLMTAVGYEIFDDLLIGNFMKVTLHGIDSLYPWFTPAVAKYADNGRAKTRAEVLRYFAEYARRKPGEFILHRIGAGVRQARAYGALRSAYFAMKGVAY